MLRQQQITEEETATQAFVHAPEEATKSAVETPKPGWRTLYELYVADNPVFWKETNRPDLSAFTPKMREKIQSNQKKASNKQKDWKFYTLQIIYSITYPLILGYLFTIFFNNLNFKFPFISFLLAPLLTPIGIAAMLSRNIPMEREKRTWNALLMTHLPPAQILAGKCLPVVRQVLLMNSMFFLMALPSIWTGRVPAIALLAAIPLLLTMNLPGALLALRAGLFGKSPEKAAKSAGFLQLGPLLLNLAAGGVGAVGVLFVARFGWLLLVPWLIAAVNVLWARALWLRLLRDFHKAPRDFSG